MISIVDYGVGNLKSLANALKFLDFESELVTTPEGVLSAKKIILPGVGAYRYAMMKIEELGLKDVLLRKAESGTPILGICLGMQLFFTESTEGHATTKGLNLIPGCVMKIEGQLKVPHMGWNEINRRCHSVLLNDIQNARYGYFVHSYHCVPDDDSCIHATTDYGTDLTAAVGKDNIYGVQFHPEKSQELGLQILRNFGALS